MDKMTRGEEDSKQKAYFTMLSFAAVRVLESQKGRKKKTLTSNHYLVSVLKYSTPTTCTFHMIK